MNLEDYSDPFQAVRDFEVMLAEFTGAEYVVCTDSCTHAMELCFRYFKPEIPDNTVTMPSRSYLSVPMMLMKLGYQVHFDREYHWTKEYRFSHTKIWDCARAFSEDMHIDGRHECLSFGHSKRLEIGHGGAILCDSVQDYTELKRMAYDGRDQFINPWQHQGTFELGFHYHMRPEDAIKGMRMLNDGDLKDPNTQLVDYPDMSRLKFIT